MSISHLLYECHIPRLPYLDLFISVFEGIQFIQGGQGRVLSIATVYPLTVRDSKPGGYEIFHTCSLQPHGPTSHLLNANRASFLGLKLPEHGVYHPPLTSAEVNERVELYLCYTPTLALMTSYRVNCTYTIHEALNYSVMSNLLILLAF
jgi:hypothetical protein